MADNGANPESKSSEWPRFIHTDWFMGEWNKLGLSGDDFHAMEALILADPLAGRIVKDTGGLRKVRFAPAGRGKSGGFRVYHAAFERHDVVVLASIFPKSAKEEMTKADKRAMAALIRNIESLLDTGNA